MLKPNATAALPGFSTPSLFLVQVKWWYATYKDFTALFLGKTESEYPACDDSSGINYTPYLTAIMLKTTDLMICQCVVSSRAQPTPSALS